MEKQLDRSTAAAIDICAIWQEIKDTWSDEKDNAGDYKIIDRFRNANSELEFELYVEMNDVLTELSDIDTQYIPLKRKN